MAKQLKEDELKELRNWLLLQGIQVKQLHRDFSDAVQAAQLLKKFYPKLIDMHNYPSRSGFQLKLDNWETLNVKALNKIGLNQTKTKLERFAKGTPGAIELLLNDIMLLENARSLRDGRNHDDAYGTFYENDDIIMVTVNKKIGDAIVQVPQKMILFSSYEQLVRESAEKDNYLAIAQQKIAHLENIIKQKAERIDELCQQLVQLSSRIAIQDQGPPHNANNNSNSNNNNTNGNGNSNCNNFNNSNSNSNNESNRKSCKGHGDAQREHSSESVAGAL